MRRDRIYTFEESRVDRPVHQRREPRPRATVLPADPAWLHDGLTLVLNVRGVPTDLFTVGIMGKALGRSPESVRRLIRQGVLPEARYRTTGRGRYGQKRLWTRPQLLAAAAAMEALGLRERRPRGRQEFGAGLAVVATA